MKKVETIILDRTDIMDGCKNIPIYLLSFDNFKISNISIFQENPIVLFIDDNGETKILKNRFGDDGFNTIKKTIKYNEEQNFIKYISIINDCCEKVRKESCHKE